MNSVSATMAGSVWKILKGVGDEVKEGEEVIILESMKMEIPISTEVAGKVKEVRVSEGDFVNEGDIVIVLD